MTGEGGASSLSRTWFTAEATTSARGTEHLRDIGMAVPGVALLRRLNGIMTGPTAMKDVQPKVSGSTEIMKLPRSTGVRFNK